MLFWYFMIMIPIYGAILLGAIIGIFLLPFILLDLVWDKLGLQKK